MHQVHQQTSCGPGRAGVCGCRQTSSGHSASQRLAWAAAGKKDLCDEQDSFCSPVTFIAHLNEVLAGPVPNSHALLCRPFSDRYGNFASGPSCSSRWHLQASDGGACRKEGQRVKPRLCTGRSTGPNEALNGTVYDQLDVCSLHDVAQTALLCPNLTVELRARRRARNCVL